ncbi:hypothetical protein [Williamsia sp. CHRR-6]|uniref:hypothetical protein n=1 Tax=Williamsia sp. CHRR-6 TaxID=2835871 RepID=UPI001BD9BD86|nr:hypothetical protein [Williamsia sp. CHRR-6]MBT0566089.1 hypothetical protein [Williamsia sp. CHRR-6]
MEQLVTQPSVIQLNWTRRVAYRDKPIRDILPFAIGGIILMAVSLLVGQPLLSIAFLALAGIGFLNYLRPRMRLRIDADSVLLLPETPLRNAMTFLSAIFFLMAAAAVAQVVVGSQPDLRLALVAAGLCGVAVLLGVMAVLTSGPVRISGTTVTLFGDRKFSIADDSFAVAAMPRGPPVVKFSHTSRSGARPVNLTRGQFGIDAETVAATLEHLRMWTRQGRIGTAAEIAAMLSVAPPQGLDVGQSVVIEVAVPNEAGTE